jgi:hypothetical protein
METSGLLFTQHDDGSIRAEVVDYGVSEFGGGDWESWYDLDKENAQKLYALLKKKHSGTFEEMMVAEFGKVFQTYYFERFCRENDIHYVHDTWR